MCEPPNLVYALMLICLFSRFWRRRAQCAGCLPQLGLFETLGLVLTFGYRLTAIPIISDRCYMRSPFSSFDTRRNGGNCLRVTTYIGSVTRGSPGVHAHSLVRMTHDSHVWGISQVAPLIDTARWLRLCLARQSEAEGEREHKQEQERIGNR